MILISTDKYEIMNFISSLDSNKSTESNSIPTKIQNLLKNDIFTQLSDICNVSFSTDVISSMGKKAKVRNESHSFLSINDNIK